MQRSFIHYRVKESAEKAFCLPTLIQECKYLYADKNIETRLSVFPRPVTAAPLLSCSYCTIKKLLKKQKYKDIYQLAGFRPGYCFGGSPACDAAGCTNCSPFFVIQILRGESISKVLVHYPHLPETIS